MISLPGIRRKKDSGEKTGAAVEEQLKNNGPLWAAGYWYGAPHIIVITGAEPNGKLYVNDPASGPKEHDMKFFNEKIAKDVHNPLMYLPNSRVNPKGYATYF